LFSSLNQTRLLMSEEGSVFSFPSRSNTASIAATTTAALSKLGPTTDPRVHILSTNQHVLTLYLRE